ncbi:MAG: leucine-rich repeat protein [Candidatus Scatomorpha sp.]
MNDKSKKKSKKESVLTGEDKKLVKQNLEEITAILLKRYDTEEKKLATLGRLSQENLDLPIGLIGTWSKEIFGQAATTYLKEKGILLDVNWAKVQRERNEAYEASRQESLRELNAPVETVLYNPPIYYVEEVDVSGKEADEWKYRTDSENKELICLEDYLGSSYHVIVPAFINGKKVHCIDNRGLKTCKATIVEMPGSIKKIGFSVGEDNKNIKKIVIGEGVETIGKSCFKEAVNLKEVEVSGSVIDVGYGSFSGTPWHQSQENLVIVGSVLLFVKKCGVVINIPQGIKTIGSLDTIGYASDLRKVVIPETVTTLSKDAFSSSYFAEIQEFVYTDSLVNIGKSAFGRNKWTESFVDNPIIVNNQLYRFNSNEKQVNIPEGITEIFSDAFSIYNKNYIETITLPKTLKRIRKRTFSSFNNLTSVYLQEGLESLENECFCSCKKLGRVVIPDSVLEIGDSAFNYCAALTEVSFGKNVSKIGKDAFGHCSALSRVYLPDSLLEIEDKLFSGCTSLNEIHFPTNLTKIGKSAFSDCTSLDGLYLPESVSQIGAHAFSGCISLSRIEIPKAVKEISAFTFMFCENLKEIILSENISHIHRRAFCRCSKLKKIILPAKLETIEESLFYGCVSLDEISIPNLVVSVGEGAFSGCSGIKKLNLPNKLKVIEKEAFKDCTGLGEVVIPDSVASVGEGAFSGCSGIKKLVLPDKLEVIEKEAFKDCVSLSEVVIPDSVACICEGAFSGCTSLEKIIIPDSVQTLEKNAFKDCANLSDITLPKSIEYLAADTLTNTPLLVKKVGDFDMKGGIISKYTGSDKQVTIPNNVIGIGPYSFSEAYQVETITIPDSVKVISEKMMGDTPYKLGYPEHQLKKLIIGNGVIKIGNAAFNACNNLSEIIFGSALTTIETGAFAYMRHLNEIDLSKTSLIEVGEYAFSGCYNVESIKLSNKTEVLKSRSFEGIPAAVVRLPKSVKRIEKSAFDEVSELILYDTTLSYADKRVNCMVEVMGQPGLSLRNKPILRSYHITVLSSENDEIRYRIFCDGKEHDDYWEMIRSAWSDSANFNFEIYDAFFIKTHNPTGRTEMAFCRLQYPEGLSEVHRANYEAFLERCMFIERSAKRTAELIATDDSAERLAILAGYGSINKRNLNLIKDVFEAKNAKRCLAYLDEEF